MRQRIELSTKEQFKDVSGSQLSARLKKELGMDLRCSFVDVYNIQEELAPEEMGVLAQDVFADRILQYHSFNDPLFRDCWRIEVGLLPGVTDNIGRTASEAIKDRLGRDIAVFYSRLYAIHGDVDESAVQRIAALLYNPLVERSIIHPPGTEPASYLPKVRISHEPEVQAFTLHLGKKRFETMAKERLLSLSYDEFNAIKAHFKQENILAEREKVGLDNKLTDVELEAFAQTWSEHCKHKIFNALIQYDEEGEKHAINS
ncbi:MAG: phosphoribosylformylglycinamidine synthase, partial [Candidatus Micrarchaeota archaeon]